MSDIATKFIFVFDCLQDMDVFYQPGKFVRTSYSDFALYFMVPLPAEYTAVDYMAYLNRKYAKYLNMCDSDFEIDELKVNSKILYTPREIEVKIKRRNEMKNMFFDNFIEPVFADNEPIIGRIITKGEPEITLRDFHLEYSVERYPFVQMDFNISPGVITEDKRFSIKRYLDNNAVYGIPKTSYRYPLNMDTYKGGYLKKRALTFKLYSGVERSSQRYKTICVWEDGEKTTIYCDKPVNGAPVARAFAWCYVKRTFGTVSHFKKHVDKRITKIGGVIYFEGDCIQDDYAQASVGQEWIQYDIYDAAALAITAKRYGGLKKLNDDYIKKAVDIDADLREEDNLSEVLDDTKKKKTKKSSK